MKKLYHFFQVKYSLNSWQFIFFILLCVSNLTSSAQRDTIAFNNGWFFSTDKNTEGFNEKWFEKDLPGARTINLPHTWNIEEENQNHYGWGWYQKNFFVPSEWKDKNIVLQFGAINHTSIIYVNGKKIDENTGDGFSKFFIHLNGKINYREENIISIAVNNDYGKNKVPYSNSFDWPNDGGIIRKAALIVSGNPSAEYLHVTPTLNIKDSSATLKIRVGFENITDKNIELAVGIREENQPTQNTVLQTTLKPEWQNNTASVELFLPKVHPWHFDFPNLYRIDVSIKNKNLASDKISTVVGFREIKFEEGKTYLNGERIKLMGVEWTSGSNPNIGFAETDSVILSYCKLMKDVNAIFTRQHFQQDELFYDFCDRNGILVQQELPLWGPETPANDTIKNIAMKQLESMIQNYYNHACIISWGVGNELWGQDADMKKLIADLITKAKTLDSTRFTSYVSNSLTFSFYNAPEFIPDAADYGDLIMMNEYGGSWWDVPLEKIPAYLDSVHLTYPDKPFFISEFGLCEPNFKGGDERRINDMISHMKIYESKPYIEGAIYFDLTDYRTHYPGTTDTTKYRRRIHGVYDMYGIAKPSMKILRELSSPVEIQQIQKAENGKLSITIAGNFGLPQHIVRGYKLYVSDKSKPNTSGKMYELPEIKPGEIITFELDDLNDNEVMITIVRPTGYVVLEKLVE